MGAGGKAGGIYSIVVEAYMPGGQQLRKAADELGGQGEDY